MGPFHVVYFVADFVQLCLEAVAERRREAEDAHHELHAVRRLALKASDTLIALSVIVEPPFGIVLREPKFSTSFRLPQRQAGLQ
jgi:hypothetical protein